MINDFFRVASCSPRVSVADPMANARAIIDMLDAIAASQPHMAVFPEMCITAYTCADLFHNDSLLQGASQALRLIVDNCPPQIPLVWVGMPVACGGAIYNCAVALTHGRVLGIVPKTYLPTYNEFYERRWFAPAPDDSVSVCLFDGPGGEAPMSASLLFDVGGVKVGAEICEDLWVPAPPSSFLAMEGAEVIANLSASNDAIGKYSYLRSLVCGQSARIVGAYVYASAGYGESTTDMVFFAKNIICENGRVLAANRRSALASGFEIADIDICAIRHDRRHISTFADCAARHTSRQTAVVAVPCPTVSHKTLLRSVDPMPFVPSDAAHLRERCSEIIDIQAAGLCKRLEVTHSRSLVVGISGGLDSTLALLVACRAFDLLAIPRSGIIGITMPGFGTTGRTRTNAHKLMEALGVSVREISIAGAVEGHFADIGHDPAVHDVTYENSQARERTQILMDVANQAGALVLGTGDLSELALGWATYNGDHMSMYGVNSGVPKTLVKHLVGYFASEMPAGEGRDALLDIIDTPISPELIPADSQGNITQKTEDLVGPYELHDFFLYHTLRHGFTPRRIYRLALKAFDGRFDAETIRRWMRTFFRRFFAQQFKRSCLPDGPKVGSVTLSPRGDWRMPSDASAALWLSECDDLTI